MIGFPLLSAALPPGATLAVAPAQVADTVLAIPARDGFDLIFGVTAGIIGLTFLAVLLAFLFLLFQARKAARAVEEARRRFAQDRGVEYLRRAAENLEKISRTLRDEAETIQGAGAKVSDRLTQVSDRMEERIEEFNALMEVIQDEAEGIFVDTASTARGVRRGIGRLGDGRRDRGRGVRHRRAGEPAESDQLPPAPRLTEQAPDTQVTAPPSPPEPSPGPPADRTTPPPRTDAPPRYDPPDASTRSDEEGR